MCSKVRDWISKTVVTKLQDSVGPCYAAGVEPLRIRRPPRVGYDILKTSRRRWFTSSTTVLSDMLGLENKLEKAKANVRKKAHTTVSNVYWDVFYPFNQRRGNVQKGVILTLEVAVAEWA